MSALTERVAAEHRLDDFSTCVCDEERRTPTEYAAHVAEVTEAATRAQVAADIEAAVDLADHAYVRTGMRNGAQIARGGESR